MDVSVGDSFVVFLSTFPIPFGAVYGGDDIPN